MTPEGTGSEFPRNSFPGEGAATAPRDLHQAPPGGALPKSQNSGVRNYFSRGAGAGNLAGPGCCRAGPAEHPRGVPTTAPLARLLCRGTRPSPAPSHLGRVDRSPRTAAGLLTRGLFRRVGGFVRGCWAMLSRVPCAKEEGVSSSKATLVWGPALPGAGGERVYKGDLH